MLCPFLVVSVFQKMRLNKMETTKYSNASEKKKSMFCMSVVGTKNKMGTKIKIYYMNHNISFQDIIEF